MKVKAKAKKKQRKFERSKKRRRPKKAKQVVKGRWVRRKRVKSLDELIVWRPHPDDPSREYPTIYTFDPVVVPLRLLPWDIRDHYTRKEIDLVSAMAYPGPKRQIYGKALEPLIYFVVQRADDLKQAWAELPHPSLRGEKRYWQIDHNIKFYRPWPY